MRWFKHITTASNDEIMSELMDEFGVAGYGIWWIVLEKIAHTMDKTDCCFARFSIKVWSTSCRVSSKKFQKFVRFLKAKNVFDAKFDGDYIEIGCRNLLKYRDEYTTRAKKPDEECRDKLPTLSGVCPLSETEAETETELKTDLKKKNIKENKSLTSDVDKVFNAWALTMNKSGAILGDKRSAAVKKAMKMGYEVNQLIDAIVGCSLTPFNCGQNAQNQRYDELELIVRNESNIERFIENGKKYASGNAQMSWGSRKFNPDDWIEPVQHSEITENEVIDNDGR